MAIFPCQKKLKKIFFFFCSSHGQWDEENHLFLEYSLFCCVSRTRLSAFRNEIFILKTITGKYLFGKHNNRKTLNELVICPTGIASNVEFCRIMFEACFGFWQRFTALRFMERI